YQHYYSIPYSF
nr:immunoglobulin light chain junction region [Macaca mulatta]